MSVAHPFCFGATLCDWLLFPCHNALSGACFRKSFTLIFSSFPICLKRREDKGRLFLCYFLRHVMPDSAFIHLLSIQIMYIHFQLKGTF